MDNHLWDRLTGIFREVLDDTSLTLTESTTAKEVPGWDSITHVLLIVAIEKQFKVKFTAGEIQQLHNVGELAGLIAARQPAAALP